MLTWIRKQAEMTRPCHVQNTKTLDVERAKRLRNQVNRAAPKLRRQFYQSRIASIEATSSRDWWKHMKTLLGNSPGGQNEMLRLANAFTGGDMDTLANRMNE